MLLSLSVAGLMMLCFSPQSEDKQPQELGVEWSYHRVYGFMRVTYVGQRHRA